LRPGERGGRNKGGRMNLSHLNGRGGGRRSRRGKRQGDLKRGATKALGTPNSGPVRKEMGDARTFRKEGVAISALDGLVGRKTSFAISGGAWV